MSEHSPLHTHHLSLHLKSEKRNPGLVHRCHGVIIGSIPPAANSSSVGGLAPWHGFPDYLGP